MDQGKLDLLILEEVLKPTETAIAVLSEIIEELKSGSQSAVVLAGLYVLAVSQLEIAITDTIRYILKRNPWKMNFGSLTLGREKLLDTELVRELLELHADDLVQKWTYRHSEDLLLDRLYKIADIPERSLESNVVIIQEFKKRRNEILHRSRPTANRDNQPIPWVTKEETSSAVQNLKKILINIRDSLKYRYDNHTRVEALRRLWSYLFTSPVMKFDDYWVIDTVKDRIIGYKDTPLINQLASSERVLLGVWRAEFASDSSLLQEFNMKSLGHKRRQDLVTLLAALRDLWLY